MGTMKAIMLMLAILILAVSMIACGASAKNSSQPAMTLGDWTGTITGVPAPPFTSSTAVLNFGAPQSATGWFDSSVSLNDTCGFPDANTLTTTRNGNNFTMSGPDGYVGSSVLITGTVSGTTASGTINFSSLCAEPSWTGDFTATLQPGTQQPMVKTATVWRADQ